MAEKKIGSPAYGKIEHESGRRTYRFAEKFIQATGIDAVLNEHSNACIDDEHPGVSFNIHGGGLFTNQIYFIVEGDRADVEYDRITSKGIKQMFKHADLRSTLARICRNAGYTFQNTIPSGNPYSGILIKTEVPTEDYTDFAEFMGNVDRMISLYLKIPFVLPRLRRGF